MNRYKVISPFVERDDDGNPTGNRPQPGETVNLSEAEGIRLKKAKCVIEIEDRMERAPEDRVTGKRGRRARSDR